MRTTEEEAENMGTEEVRPVTREVKAEKAQTEAIGMTETGVETGATQEKDLGKPIARTDHGMTEIETTEVKETFPEKEEIQEREDTPEKEKTAEIGIEMTEETAIDGTME